MREPRADLEVEGRGVASSKNLSDEIKPASRGCGRTVREAKMEQMPHPARVDSSLP
ncbi:hypothetical protein [Corynebacterium auriscanis]|uniref:hypothetical protein n=1 Tax=Corynebacterium auriscanis TaxID=99807 RepID=UPI003CEB0943